MVSAKRAVIDDVLFLCVVNDVVAVKPLTFLKGLNAAYSPAEMLARKAEMHIGTNSRGNRTRGDLPTRWTSTRYPLQQTDRLS
jgi:hypothetical protein